MSNQIFQTLKELPIPLDQVQCVLYKHELLICGGYEQRACYSYHKIKNEYKFICEYPSDVQLKGHCVVKLVDNSNNNNKDSNQITVLSFGGLYKHTLVMKYVSVWSDKSKNSNNYNQWIPFTDNHNNQIDIGGNYGDYVGVRAVVSGSNNHLLFITYQSKNISVFDLNIFQFIKRDILPTDFTNYHCFVSNSENGQGQEMIKTNQGKIKQNYKMLLFCKKTGLSIEYDEDSNSFQFRQLTVCHNIEQFFRYAYVCINGVILFFGGWNCKIGSDRIISKSVHKYSIRENKWMTFKNTLLSPLQYCTAILSEEDNYIHIIGGLDKRTVSTNEIKCIIQYWTRTFKIKLGWIDDFNQIIMKYNRMK
ncbi:hypothetical protein RFI_07623 [Reticulomyxa filosa]|uniref:Kelch motif family protein n=1 Tax=Reticulomyxa filosa TaxID=46433 RepID=X6NW49_RETFI|nr:hypothetical protein RFI_07623 [Reticulomyxa filosa]|eukprot:ETO29497.1 hypothetical protein RFI_07623 [Reticulomyxa filosa]